MIDPPLVWFAAVIDEPGDERDECDAIAAELVGAAERDWDVGPALLVNEIAVVASGEDAEIWARGIALRVSDATSAPLDVTRDRQQYEDVVWMLDAVHRLSQELGVFVVELDGRSVGRVVGGEGDRMLVEGLLNPWQQEVGSESRSAVVG